MKLFCTYDKVFDCPFVYLCLMMTPYGQNIAFYEGK